jgi:modulator of FtsH protease HflK
MDKMTLPPGDAMKPDERGGSTPSKALPRGGWFGLPQQLRYWMHLLGLHDKGLLLVGALIGIAWVNSGIYKVQPDEQGVVLRFGRWVDTTSPGLHYHWPYPLERVLFPKVTQVNQLQLGGPRASTPGTTDEAPERQMLTGDENIVEAECAVLWRIKDAGRYLFRIQNSESTLKVTAESALREIIGRTPIQAAMSDRRQQIADETRSLLQALLDKQGAGIEVTQVQLQRVDPPGAVIDAFNDVQRARADQERARNEAEAYANDVIPRARGDAARITQESEAYRAQVVNLATGEANGFLSVYESYAKAKDVTSWRLYLEAVDEVLKKAGRVIVDGSGKGVSGIVPYLPLADVNTKDKTAPAAKDASKDAGK